MVYKTTLFILKNTVYSYLLVLSVHKGVFEESENMSVMKGASQSKVKYIVF